MLKIEKTEVLGWEQAIRGMRNPMNSWENSDSRFASCDGDYYNIIGDHFPGCEIDTELFYRGSNDRDPMLRLAQGGPVHAKYRRMIVVYADITAPLYWWEEFDTYKVGTVANSCSTMHKIQAKEFTLEDFSHDHLIDDWDKDNNDAFYYPDSKGGTLFSPLDGMRVIIGLLNINRQAFLDTKNKKYWWQMIQLLPSSYNQKQTVMMNYEVLAGIYPMGKDHKLDEWHVFCDWIKELPYSDIIIGNTDKEV